MRKCKGILMACMALAAMTYSCNDASNKHMTDASQNIKEANADVNKAILETGDSAKAAAVSNWKTFNNESDTAIAGIEKDIAVLEANIAKANNKEKKKLQADVNAAKQKLEALKARLQQKNVEFNESLQKFDSTVVSKNQSFEREFNHDIHELGTAFKDIFKDNVK